MKLKKYKTKFGKLILNTAASEASAVSDFIVSDNYLNLPSESKMALKNPRSEVWKIDVPNVGCCILKRFCVVKNRGLSRYIESNFKLRFVHRGLRTMQLALKLSDAGINTFTPYAFWTDSRGGISNYLLYKYIEGEIVGDHWMGELGAIAPPSKADEPLTEEELNKFMILSGKLVRQMHEAGVLHTDLHPKNFVSPSRLENSTYLSLIDLDSACVPIKLYYRMSFVLRIRSLRTFARCFENVEDSHLRVFVNSYSHGDMELEEAIIKSFRFWRSRRRWKSGLDVLKAFLLCPPPKKFSKWERRSYDLVFSLGQDCKCSQSLRKANLQHYSYPFDWLAEGSLSQRAEILANEFVGWFEKEDLEDICIPAVNRFAEVHNIVVNKKTAIEYRHDFLENSTIDEKYEEVAEKYKRRAKRLVDSIKKANKVLVVYTIGYRRSPVTIEELESAREVLARHYGEKIEVLGIFDDFPNHNYPPMKSVSKDGKTFRWSLPCVKTVGAEYEVKGSIIPKCLSRLISCSCPHTKEEIRKRHREEHLALYKKYKAKSFIEMMRNRMLFRKYRKLRKVLLRKGIISN